ncbi:conserved Plasmodium protein, unknown function [Plasmodium knowlesi strain H]|uniref:Nuclear speckle splicing regulatory protein 1 N-terminal domain-containing protein n=3 Tax=Plasmodium knowlesi TaxID=5850 RepID=A0A5K1UUK6_PLAKH|nr:conserved Plasmodium protein, unknown function [Plasmodium knowlesi strain H]OTN64603.1 Uncharacterized protein PKNOH_S130172400 [Plasmodium knowlesi]CAA9988892.1 conserved Plasmodium protein, unknown function [Plasmodium knowlesi strain H]SBO24733.1 conserved Plasmodium protein, unknown function [Plasmodium knowlesi strain H]SBO28001.1 conserved Plasmodium protein, unknown function [Plasmodium knowlesi strain H]VVS78366.1 conserved Plasmodium protein, unknown function [Plasmodium knowlesi |eukprot:XP_002261239.1 hypothetical protein, conserved in Plasmodium species [Plasmodium knowlesi strain H]
MKINLSVSKKSRGEGGGQRTDKEEGKSTGALKKESREVDRKSDKEERTTTKEKSVKKQIGDFFVTSDDEEEPYELENNQNKKLNEEKKKQIEKEIREYIYEHENPVETSSREELKIDHTDKKKKIRYLGYRGEELTKLNEDKANQLERKKEYGPCYKEQGESRSHHRGDDRCREKRSKEYLPKHAHGRKNTEEEDAAKLEKEIRIDDIFKKKESDQKGKSKYMDALIGSAKRRELEREMLIQKKLKIDTSKEEKVFITKAYKKKIMDRELIMKDLELEAPKMEAENRQSNFNLNLFLKNINAPSNYNRSNRRPHCEK